MQVAVDVGLQESAEQKKVYQVEVLPGQPVLLHALQERLHDGVVEAVDVVHLSPSFPQGDKQ